MASRRSEALAGRRNAWMAGSDTNVLQSSLTQAMTEAHVSTTTIRMPEDLKARVAAAAKRSGTTPHGFMLAAIAEKAEQAELRADFDAVAEARYARIVDSGKSISWNEMRGYLEQRLAGKSVKRPSARKLAR